MPLTLERLRLFLAAFGRLSIGLVGDLFLDRYLEIDPDLNELSVETGLQAYQISRIRNSPGALGTVLNNLAALGVGRLVPVTVLGDDGQAYDLKRVLRELPVDQRHILQDPRRNTPTYTKPLARGEKGAWRELNRLDLRNRAPLAAPTEEELIKRIAEAFDATDGLIVLDQVNEEGWGVVGPRVREHLAALADRQPGKVMFVDSRAHLQKFRRGILKANLAECLAASGLATGSAAETAAAAREAASRLARRLGVILYCTMGERGILVVRPDAEPIEVPGYPVAGPIDIVGAGDSATSGIVSALLAGATHEESAAVGNLVASITIQQLGTTGTASPEQVLARWDEVQR
ncbi:MAG: bifunctional heptose 7-phosphate kinase/heptose 1-phosphate adenyltransferase [Pirellulales bacterium]